ncbi:MULTISPECIES: MucB/RseB C-terminal domain-containing protein [unclassified Thioalkalivibrio]|uniref:MucB/RseB C-terminal domain-containing protein n=1 Tax=unclassified Thioalkalivibrio TaxID=2621013 RepID=UPI000372C480|nr:MULTISPECIES: MucB/RseB C-terminal domain-containing protein [unclassified Thioalkalivibrio]
MRRGLPFVLVAATALCCVPLPVLAGDQSPADWLQRMTSSLHSESYQGTFVLQRDDRLDAIRVVHAAENGGYRERLETLTGSHREILRSVDRLSALKGARAAAGEGGGGAPHWPAGAPVFLLEHHDHYALEDMGVDRVAGLECRMILARARDMLRYSHRYCLHTATALPLLSELYDGHGALLERLAFTDLEHLDEVAETALEATREDAEHVEVRADHGHKKPDWDEQTGMDGWSFANLPDGFSAIAASERRVGDDQASLRHFVLSDGLASVSVYIEKASGEQMFEGTTRAGATHGAARSIAGHQVTAVGDVPQATVRGVLDAVVHHPGN